MKIMQITDRLALKIISLALLCAGAILSIPMEQKLLGGSVLALGALVTLGISTQFARYIVLIYISIAILAATPIDTSIELLHVIQMGIPLAFAVAIPYLVMRYMYRKPGVIEYPFSKHRFTKSQIGYILFALVASYLILPFWMKTTGGHMNWSVVADPYHLFVLFLGTNGLGIWDELFFIVTVLALLRKHVPFWLANIVQATLFTAFLYELGFRSWASLLIFPFALSQGMVFRKTQNLYYIIAIHLTIDFVLYLALIHAHHPHLLPIFITG